MPKRERGQYTVVTYTVVSLCVLGAVTKAMTPFLPPPAENRLAKETGDFLRQGSRMPIQWIPWGPEVFSEARRLNRPIFLIIGDTYSMPSRHADRVVFLDTDVAAYLSAYFVCTRIDLDIHPYSRFAYVPFQRTRQTTDPACQLIFLDEQGRYLQHVVGFGVTNMPPPTAFLDQLIAGKSAFDRSKAMPFTEAPWQLQEIDIKSLRTRSSSLATPDFKLQDQEIKQRALAGGGSLSRFGVSSLWPSVYRYLWRTRRVEDLNVLLDPILLSAHIDWLDGGFFRRIRTERPFRIDYDKLARENADMMVLLAEVNHDRANAMRYRIATDTFDWLVKLADEDGIVAEADIGDEIPGNRSQRHSFPVRELVAHFSPSEVNWMQQNLNLRPNDNPLMTVVPRSPEVVADPTFDAFLDRMRNLRPAAEARSKSVRLESPASVVARLIRTASTFKDEERLRKAMILRFNLLQYVFDKDVAASLQPSVAGTTSLGDNLAIGQMEWEAYLATGRMEALQRAAEVLARAIFLFQSESAGALLPTIPAGLSAEIRGSLLPEVTDDLQPSDLATMLELAHCIGRVGSRAEDRELAEACRLLSQHAVSALAYYADDSFELAFEGSAYFNAALTALMPKHYVVVGPGSVEKARTLRNQIPGVLVAPSNSKMDHLLKNRAPGIYQIDGKVVKGPLTLEEATTAATNTWTELLNAELH